MSNAFRMPRLKDVLRGRCLPLMAANLILLNGCGPGGRDVDNEAGSGDVTDAGTQAASDASVSLDAPDAAGVLPVASVMAVADEGGLAATFYLSVDPLEEDGVRKWQLEYWSLDKHPEHLGEWSAPPFSPSIKFYRPTLRTSIPGQYSACAHLTSIAGQQSHTACVDFQLGYPEAHRLLFLTSRLAQVNGASCDTVLLFKRQGHLTLIDGGTKLATCAVLGELECSSCSDPAMLLAGEGRIDVVLEGGFPYATILEVTKEPAVPATLDFVLWHPGTTDSECGEVKFQVLEVGNKQLLYQSPIWSVQSPEAAAYLKLGAVRFYSVENNASEYVPCSIDPEVCALPLGTCGTLTEVL